MAIEKKKYGLLLLVSGAAILFLTTFFFPYPHHNLPRSLELALVLLVPLGLILFTLGVFRLGVNAVVAIWIGHQTPGNRR